jgi:ribosome-associated protein
MGEADGITARVDDALIVNERVAIPRHELTARASRAGGAGGQHVNTSSTRIELLWNVRTTTALDEEMRARALDKLASRLDGEGILRIVASDRRSQRQNRESAEERLIETVRKALVVPRKRRPTKPSRASKEKRLTEKKRRGDTKANRRKDSFD